MPPRQALGFLFLLVEYLMPGPAHAALASSYFCHVDPCLITAAAAARAAAAASAARALAAHAPAVFSPAAAVAAPFVAMAATAAAAAPAAVPLAASAGATSTRAAPACASSAAEATCTPAAAAGTNTEAAGVASEADEETAAPVTAAAADEESGEVWWAPLLAVRRKPGSRGSTLPALLQTILQSSRGTESTTSSSSTRGTGSSSRDRKSTSRSNSSKEAEGPADLLQPVGEDSAAAASPAAEHTQQQQQQAGGSWPDVPRSAVVAGTPRDAAAGPETHCLVRSQSELITSNSYGRETCSRSSSVISETCATCSSFASDSEECEKGARLSSSGSSSSSLCGVGRRMRRSELQRDSRSSSSKTAAREDNEQVNFMMRVLQQLVLVQPEREVHALPLQPGHCVFLLLSAAELLPNSRYGFKESHLGAAPTEELEVYVHGVQQLQQTAAALLQNPSRDTAADSHSATAPAAGRGTVAAANAAAAGAADGAALHVEDAATGRLPLSTATRLQALESQSRRAGTGGERTAAAVESAASGTRGTGTLRREVEAGAATTGKQTSLPAAAAAAEAAAAVEAAATVEAAAAGAARAKAVVDGLSHLATRCQRTRVSATPPAAAAARRAAGDFPLPAKNGKQGPDALPTAAAAASPFLIASRIRDWWYAFAATAAEALLDRAAAASTALLNRILPWTYVTDADGRLQRADAAAAAGARRRAAPEGTAAGREKRATATAADEEADGTWLEPFCLFSWKQQQQQAGAERESPGKSRLSSSLQAGRWQQQEQSHREKMKQRQHRRQREGEQQRREEEEQQQQQREEEEGSGESETETDSPHAEAPDPSPRPACPACPHACVYLLEVCSEPRGRSFSPIYMQLPFYFNLSLLYYPWGFAPVAWTVLWSVVAAVLLTCASMWWLYIRPLALQRHQQQHVARAPPLSPLAAGHQAEASAVAAARSSTGLSASAAAEEDNASARRSASDVRAASGNAAVPSFADAAAAAAASPFLVVAPRVCGVPLSPLWVLEYLLLLTSVALQQLRHRCRRCFMFLFRRR